MTIKRKLKLSRPKIIYQTSDSKHLIETKKARIARKTLIQEASQYFLSKNEQAYEKLSKR